MHVEVSALHAVFAYFLIDILKIQHVTLEIFWSVMRIHNELHQRLMPMFSHGL